MADIVWDQVTLEENVIAIGGIRNISTPPARIAWQVEVVVKVKVDGRIQLLQVS